MSWAPTTDTNGSKEITIAWVKENLPKGEFVFVDCREQHEWDAGHLPNAEFIPLSAFEERSQHLDKQKPVVVYCRSGMRSLRATNNLLARGFKAASMNGGYIGW